MENPPRSTDSQELSQHDSMTEDQRKFKSLSQRHRKPIVLHDASYPMKRLLNQNHSLPKFFIVFL